MLRKFAKSNYLFNTCERLFLLSADIPDYIEQIEEINKGVYTLISVVFYTLMCILFFPWLTLCFILFILTLIVAVPQGLLLGIYIIKDRKIN